MLRIPLPPRAISRYSLQARMACLGRIATPPSLSSSRPPPAWSRHPPADVRSPGFDRLDVQRLLAPWRNEPPCRVRLFPFLSLRFLRGFARDSGRRSKYGSRGPPYPQYPRPTPAG